MLELESLFQQERGNVAQTRNQQRAARARLANSLNRPGQLSSDLVAPTLPVLERVGGELEALTEAALADNPRLKALRARVEGAGQQLKGARAGDGPVIHGEIEAAAYNKVTGTRDPLSAGLVFELPLSSGGAVEAEVARNRALLAERRAPGGAGFGRDGGAPGGTRSVAGAGCPAGAARGDDRPGGIP